MKTYLFRTNAKCGGCTGKIDQKLRENPQSGSWRFDLTSPDKTLEITTDLPVEEITRLINEAGYKAEIKK